MKTLLHITACSLFLFFAMAVQASILGGEQLEVDFANEKEAAKKASWSAEDFQGKFDISAKGLGWDGQKAEVLQGWIKTKPLAVGLAWRAARSVSISVVIEPPPKTFKLNNGQASTPYVGNVFVRYSPDRTHWSTWQELQWQKDNTVRRFSGNISVPQREQREYTKLCRDYALLDVPWVDDEEAAAKWIFERDPKFFERNLPFIGYVEFLYEGEFFGGQRIKSFKASVSFGMSGLSRGPKDPHDKTDHSGPWRFMAQ